MAVEKHWSGPFDNEGAAKENKDHAKAHYPQYSFAVRKKGSAWHVYYRAKRVPKARSK